MFKKHREFLNSKSNFINLVNIERKDILDKIHKNYRLTYLKDIAIARFIEENTVKVINQLIYLNNVDINHYFIVNKESIKTLLQMIKSQNLREKEDAIKFLSELNQIARELVKFITLYTYLSDAIEDIIL